MADEKKKSLEMRVAELEDKLAQMSLTEEEMRGVQKVMGQAPAQAQAWPCSGPCISTCVIRQCIIRDCIIRHCIIQQCWECSCGPCLAGGGGGMGTGGFGGLGG